MTVRRPTYQTGGTLAEIGDADILPAALYRDTNALTSGDETFPRLYGTNNALTTATGSLRLTFFTAKRSFTTTQVCVPTGGTAAAATPTLCRIGLWTVDSSDNSVALVASVANDTTLWASSNSRTSGTRSWSSSYSYVAGQRYAIGVLVVTGAATPTFPGITVATALQAITADAPRLSGILASQTDLPSSFTSAGLTTSVNVQYAQILP